MFIECNEPVSKIFVVGGEDSSPGEFPYMVSLFGIIFGIYI